MTSARNDLRSTLTTPQLRGDLSLTEEGVIERLDEETLEERVARVVDISQRFLADPRDVTPAEVSEARGLLDSMRHYYAVLAPIRDIDINWRGDLRYDRDVPPPRRESTGA